MVKATKKAVKPKFASPKEKVSRYGLDAICDRIKNGAMLTDIALDIGVARNTMVAWLDIDPDRSARVREARSLAACAYDEQALVEIRDSADVFSLSKAKEIAHHLRWRAAKVNPGEYGDKQDINLNAKIELSPEQVQAKIERLLQKSA